MKAQKPHSVEMLRSLLPITRRSLHRWYRIIAWPSPGMTTQQAFQGKPATAHKAVAFNGFRCIGRTCGKITASRRQNRRKKYLVETNGKDEDLPKQW